MTQPHEGGITAQRKSASTAPSQDAKPAPSPPVLTSETRQPPRHDAGEQGGNGPHWAEWALVVVTGFLAIYTYRLFRATGRLVTEAGETAKRQLRAYVHVSEILPSRPLSVAAMPVLHVTIKNFGQTPAYRLRIETKTVVDRVTDPTKVTLAGKLEGGSSHVLAPGGIFRHDTDALTPTAEELKEMRAGTLRVYWFGAIEYIDAFGDFRRETVRQSLNSFNLILEVEAEGNESSLETGDLRPK